jgi:RHS repeat-associated protein
VVQWRGKLAPNGSVDTLQLHQDRIGSVVLGTRWNGAEGKTEVWTQRQYDPYGRRVMSIGWDRNEPELPYGFAGQRWDAETGLYLMGARWYSAELGRFIEQDPIAEGGGLNLYAYVGSSPTLWVDPSGLKPAELDQPPGIPGGNGASNTLDQPKYSIDAVSAVDPVTGGPLGKRVEGALKASELAQEASDWSSERKLAKAFAKAKVGSDSSVVFNVRVLDGAVSVTMNERALEGERDQVTTLPDATEAPELGAIEEGISVDFGRDLGGIEAKGTEAFLESVATHLGTIKSTATGNIALSELSRLEEV